MTTDERLQIITELTAAICKLSNAIGSDNAATVLHSVAETYLRDLSRRADEVAALESERNVLLFEQAQLDGVVH